VTTTSTHETEITADPRVPLVRITREFDGEPDGVALERLLLEDLGDGRTRLTSTSLVDSFEARDAFVASGIGGRRPRGLRASGRTARRLTRGRHALGAAEGSGVCPAGAGHRVRCWTRARRPSASRVR
jgi:hypothetical protein